MNELVIVKVMMENDAIEADVEELRALAEKTKPKYPETTFKSFLEDTPPDIYVYVTDLRLGSDGRGLLTPDLTLYCENDTCSGPRLFRASDHYQNSSWAFNYLTYTCRNCGSRTTRFAIAMMVIRKPATEEGKATCIKLGQLPAFGPQTPAKVITLVGPDRELFLQGRRAENRGLGIGAFAYYRRVVENQKNRLISEIAKVSRVIGTTSETEELFSAAIAEGQFSKSVAMIKDVIPQSLLVRGHNPLTLLHSALSKGLHDEEMTDAHCLERAQSIRTVLFELAERSSEALRNSKELELALKTLVK